MVALINRPGRFESEWRKRSFFERHAIYRFQEVPPSAPFSGFVKINQKYGMPHAMTSPGTGISWL